MLATASATWLSLETSQIIAWVSGSSCSSATIRSGERASAMTRNPPPAKRRTIADPVPGPTPVTTAIRLSGTVYASPSLHAGQRDRRALGQRFCERKSGLAKFGVRHHAIDQTERLGAARVDPLRQEHQLACPRGSRKPRQQPGDAVVSRQADTGISRGHDR